MEKWDELLALRAQAKDVRDPTCAEETLEYLLNAVRTKKPHRILEIGAAEGLTSVALSLVSDAKVTAIELDSERAKRARRNFEHFGVDAELFEGDAGEILPLITGSYEMIFLDGPKAQYRHYLPDCKRLLVSGGTLYSDDVLLFGWVRGEPPKKRRMLVEHLRQYLKELEEDPGFETEILELGEGLAVSVKK